MDRDLLFLAAEPNMNYIVLYFNMHIKNSCELNPSIKSILKIGLKKVNGGLGHIAPLLSCMKEAIS